MIRLEVIAGSAPGRVFTLTKDVNVIGRGPNNDVVLDDAHVSARHASIALGLHQAALVDLASTNGTAILRGGERLVLSAGSEGTELASGDVIELGHDDEITRLKVTLAEDERSAHLVSVLA